MRYMLFLASLILLASIIAPHYAGGDDVHRGLSSGSATVTHSAGLEPVARQVMDLYPEMLSDIETALGIKMPPSNVLLNILNKEQFQALSGGSPVMAFAIPSANSITLDYDALGADILVLRATLKHEIAHLAIHSATGNSMPKWLDEGISQWASGGHSEIRQNNEIWPLSKAALTGRLIPLDTLASSFPRDEEGMRLAYKESLSAVDLLISNHGEMIISQLLRDAASGMSISESFQSRTGVSLNEFALTWETRLRSRASIMSFIKTYFYEVLFLMASVVLIAGYLRNHYRIRTYKDPEEDKDPQETEEEE